jgi:hypothetical protein
MTSYQRNVNAAPPPSFESVGVIATAPAIVDETAASSAAADTVGVIATAVSRCLRFVAI